MPSQKQIIQAFKTAVKCIPFHPASSSYIEVVAGDPSFLNGSKMEYHALVRLCRKHRECDVDEPKVTKFNWIDPRIELPCENKKVLVSALDGKFLAFLRSGKWYTESSPITSQRAQKYCKMSREVESAKTMKEKKKLFKKANNFHIGNWTETILTEVLKVSLWSTIPD